MTVTKKRTKARPAAQFPPPGPESDRLFEQDLHDTLVRSAALSQTVDHEKSYLVQRAPNVIEWITQKRFCNQPSIYKHWGAYSLVKEFFELRCPVCNSGSNAVPRDPWGLSRQVLESEVLMVWTPRHEDESCPKCGTTRSEFVEEGLFKSYRMLDAIIGQRSGKSSTLALVATYIEHVVLTIAHGYDGGLQGYFGMPKGEPLHITCVASTDTQAKETIWAKFRNYRASAPWFQRYVPWVKSQERIQQTPEGMQRWEYTESDKTIKNEMIGLYLDSLNSNSNGLAGRTRIAALIDEICRMEQTESSKSAQEVYRTMDASCQTVQGLVDQHGLVHWLGMIASISSPISEDDYGMQLLRVAEVVPRMFAVHKSTWDFNPWLPYESFADMLKKDYVGTMRNFGAKPPGAANPLIDRPKDFIASAVDPELKPTATFDVYNRSDNLGRTYVAVRLDRADLILGGEPRFIAADAGKNFDAFSVACAHGEEDEDGNVVTVFDWIIRLLTTQKGQEVYFESIYQLLADLDKSYVIKQVEFDHWNSTTIVQRIRTDLNIFAEEAATTNEHFIQFMRDAYSGQIRLLPEMPNDAALDPPYKSPQGAAIYELLHLERDPKNDKVFNSKKGLRKGWDSDDTARVLVHAHRLVQDQGYTRLQDDVSRRARRKRAEASIAEWSAGGRGQVFRPPLSRMGIHVPSGNKRGW